MTATQHPHALNVEHTVTADMADGQPLPPLIENGVTWRVVCRAGGHTLWRRLFLSIPLVIDWRNDAGDHSRAP
jgi:hypothetical protein